MKIIRMSWLVVSVIALSGCAMTGVQQGLTSKPGLELSAPDQYGQQHLQSVTLTRPNAPHDAERLSFCVAKTVPKQQFTLSGNEEAYSNLWLGIYHHDKDVREVGVGGGRHYVSDDGRTIITRGTAKDTGSAGILSADRGIRYTLEISPQGERMRYQFTDIQQAQLDTGVVTNNGFGVVGAWAGADPIGVYRKLVDITNDINHCLLL